MEKQRCENCLYSRKREGEENWVNCCRYPKRPVDGFFRFPKMKVDEWCGEWRTGSEKTEIFGTQPLFRAISHED